MGDVTPERLLRALWRDTDVLVGSLSLLSIERIATPWQKCNVMSPPDILWTAERRSLVGQVIARAGTVGGKPVARLHLTRGSKQVPTSQKDADRILREIGWLLVDLPKVGHWTPGRGGGSVRMTTADTIVAQVTPASDPRRYRLYMVLDEEAVDFEGTEEKARSVLDRKLEDAGFTLPVRHYRCLGCGAMDGEMDTSACVHSTTSHHAVEVDAEGNLIPAVPAAG
jgi:hypothetical protein